MGHTQGTLPAPGLYQQQTAPELLGLSTAAAHEISPSGAQACVQTHSSVTAESPSKDQSQHTHTPAQCWLALLGLLPADPGCGKHLFFHIPSFNSSSLLPKYSHHPGLSSPSQPQSGSVSRKIADNQPFVLVLALSFRFKITSSPGSACVYGAACPSIVCVGFPWGFCSQACGHISPACMFLNKQLSHCFSKGLSCLTRKSFICALIHSWLLCLL